LYAIPALPAGTYTVKFELAGFATIERQTTVALGLTVDQNVSLRPAGVTESVQVVAETPAPIATPVVGANYKHEEIESLATLRTIQGIAQLAPALTTNSRSRSPALLLAAGRCSSRSDSASSRRFREDGERSSSSLLPKSRPTSARRRPSRTESWLDRGTASSPRGVLGHT